MEVMIGWTYSLEGKQEILKCLWTDFNLVNEFTGLTSITRRTLQVMRQITFVLHLISFFSLLQKHEPTSRLS
jgi:hypothetical protein